MTTETRREFSRRWAISNGLCDDLDDNQARALEAIVAMGQIYNLPIRRERWNEEWQDTEHMGWYFETFPGGVAVELAGGELATFDGDGLTAIVRAAHRLAVRISVSAVTDEDPATGVPRGRGRLRIQANARTHHRPGMPFWARHPTPAALANQ